MALILRDTTQRAQPTQHSPRQMTVGSILTVESFAVIGTQTVFHGARKCLFTRSDAMSVPVSGMRLYETGHSYFLPQSFSVWQAFALSLSHCSRVTDIRA